MYAKWFLHESFLVPLSTVIFLSLCGLCNGSCGTWEIKIKVDHATCKSGVRELINIVNYYYNFILPSYIQTAGCQDSGFCSLSL